MSTAKLLTGSFFADITELVSRRRASLLIATPFLTSTIAQWLVGRPAAGSGDRRLLVAWAPESIAAGYLSAEGVAILRNHGFCVRDLRTLHAKVIIAGPDHAYLGSGNLTSYGLRGGNEELGLLLPRGALVRQVRAQFETWWSASGPDLTRATIQAGQLLEIRAAGRFGSDHERQPGHHPRQLSPIDLTPTVPDPAPAPGTTPPTIAQLWGRDTVAEKRALIGRPLTRWDTGRRPALLEIGSRAFTVAWAPGGGLRVISAMRVKEIRKRSGRWHVSGEPEVAVAFDRVITGPDYERLVRVQGERSAPLHHRALSPFSYIAAQTVAHFDELLKNG